MIPATTAALLSRAPPAERVLAAAPGAIAVTDADGVLLDANAAFGRLLGRAPDALVGRRLADFLHPDEADDQPLLQALARGPRGAVAAGIRAEMRFEREHGQAVWVDLAGAPRQHADGGFAGLTLVALDITARRLEDARRHQRQSLALQSAGLGLWEWQVQTGAMSFDMYWAMTLGYAVSELAPWTRTWQDLQHPDDRAGVAAQLKPCLKGEVAEYRIEHRMRHKEGHWVWLLDSGMVTERTPEGRACRVLGTSQDITQRKHAEAALLLSRQRQALALESARLGQWDWDVTTGEVTFDERFARIVGYRPGELASDISAWEQLDHPDDAAMIEAQLEAHLRGEAEAYVSEHRIVHKDGHAVWVLGTGMVVERDAQGRPLRMVGLHRDISEGKRFEADLLAAKEAADAANRAKSGFLANMSHEIRTPMNAMIGLTRLVLDTQLDLRQRDFLQKVHASSKSLLGILNDILDYSKIEAGRLEVETVQFALEEPLQSVANLYGAQVEQKGLELFFEVAPEMPMEIVGDPLRLTQVLNNLVGNAIKFTEHGQIHVKADLASRDAEGLVLRFAVRDTGIGLSEDQIGRLFRAFTQADNSVTRKHGGTGLGLTISQQLVGLMGGRLEASGAPGTGCTFTFTVRVQPAATVNLSLDLHRVRGLRALVVDDQETSRAILESLFIAWGLQVETAASATDGLARIDQSRVAGRPFDVVLLDWRMPGMNGIEMAQCMRRQSPDGSCPPFAIMVTAFGREQLVAEAGDLPLDVVLTKPVVPSALFDILMRLRQKDGAALAVRPGNPVAAPRFDGGRVLLVEDNLLNQEVASEFLRGLGVEVVIAPHGGTAVEEVQRAGPPFHLVLMDLHMPEMDGLTAAREIGRLPEGAELPVVAMTAAVMSEDRAACVDAGMVDFVAKPVDPDELIRVLRRWLPATRGHGVPAPPGARPVGARDAALPDFAGFDVGGALRRLHGQRDRLQQLLASFAASQHGAAAAIAAELAADAPAQARHRLHALKGSAATLGLVRVAEHALDVESALLRGELHPSCGALAEALHEAVTAIDGVGAPEAIADETPDTASPLLTFDPAALAQLLRDLCRYLKEQELIPDDLLDDLKRLCASHPHGAALAGLNQHIFDFDHTAALADIERLAGSLRMDL